ncbi:hypothetical protein Trco_003127 [Trichoderma cornu-damae]|uniref:Uncharacterized protein n=1 Tax=Trichoderma cornu-damae TaxID=654480 RepID=A0A9P8QRA4_9HYPO|nr:hypothetical protein Trco_003127 [Trichoderma cornu-damae]
MCSILDSSFSNDAASLRATAAKPAKLTYTRYIMATAPATSMAAVTMGPAAAAAAVLNEVVVLEVGTGRPDATEAGFPLEVVAGAADD